MKNNQSVAGTFRAVAILAIATGMVIAPANPVQAAGDPIVVIVNGSNPVDNLTMGELRKLFLAERSHWNTGRDVAPVMLPAGAPERTLFLKAVCGMTDDDFDRYFLQLTFAGKSPIPPKSAGKAQDVRRIVGNSPGAIGFVRFSDLQRDGDTVIKIVKIDGVAATDAAYKIHL
jgi:ABC-type phosphate transport system substrate-binding protein